MTFLLDSDRGLGPGPVKGPGVAGGGRGGATPVLLPLTPSELGIRYYFFQ